MQAQSSVVTEAVEVKSVRWALRMGRIPAVTVLGSAISSHRELGLAVARARWAPLLPVPS